MEAFLTQQGEGFHTGEQAYFIRLGGCDVGCHWCDTMDSWNMDAHPRLAVTDIVKAVEIEAGGIVVVTGGEPTMHDMTSLTDALHGAAFKTHIETAGSYELTGDWDWICLSPKKPVPPYPAIFGLANELKIVIFNQDDFRWAEENAARVNPECKLYLQPEWSKEEEMRTRIEEFIVDHPNWSLSVQTHKHLGIR
ncbi:MAG: 7-carboxy-7-deazaguanine synthase QueE [Flavobacteriales bacterium]|nr:7-carboxy-7-deazaguanine synthase QueE [Flavobacteriales bacterium]